MEKTKIKKIPGVPEGIKWEIKDRLYEMTAKNKVKVFLQSVEMVL